MKICTICSLEYEPYGQRCSYCRQCRREYDREYHRNKSVEAKLRKQKLQRERHNFNRDFVWNYLLENPCETCGEGDPIVLEFDHVDQSTKEFEISAMYGYALEKIVNEISKCRVLCANCHRRHTYSQLGWYTPSINNAS